MSRFQRRVFVLLLGQLTGSIVFTQTLLPLGSSKCIVIMNKYKQHTSLRSLKRIEWELLKVATILNTKRVYSNLAEQW